MLNNKRRGLVLVISSPSGAGKTTICKKVINEVEGVALSISATTRKRRKGEIEGKDYFFKNNHEFLKMLKNKRASEDKENFLKRMSEARKEISHFNEYDFIIINDEIDVAFNNVKAILYSERLRGFRQIKLDKAIDNIL